VRRDIRDPLVIYTTTDGFVNTGFTVVPTGTFGRIGRGHYVLVPVLNEQAGEALLVDLKRRADQPSGD
jgi:hypothetical protein